MNAARKLEFPRASDQLLQVKVAGHEITVSVGRIRNDKSGAKFQFLTYVVGDRLRCRFSGCDDDSTVVLWIGRVDDLVKASFGLSIAEAFQVAELLEIQMPAARAAA